MEVHKHPHHVMHKKKFGEYFLEFLMIFLAVTLGFIAENIRENISEGHKAKEMAKNLYNEIYEDSISVQQNINNRVAKERDCVYFINYVKDSNLTNLSSHFFPSFAACLIQTQYIIFEPNDGILTQLRNSGELRYFKNADLQAAIGKLSVKIAYVRSRNDKEYSYVESYARPFSLKYFDFAWYESFTQNGNLTLWQALHQNPYGAALGKLSNAAEFNRYEAENLVSYYLLMLRSTRKIQYKEFADANHSLLELLRKEYHL
jgi:hypothetical protein